MDIAKLVLEYGFETVALVFLGYFVWYVWNFVAKELNPKLSEMHVALIRVIDQNRMLDQDMIRLQQKVNVVLTYRDKEDIIQDAEEKEALAELQEQENEQL
tara:strand:+ start:1138 stop:1440 length:303 start_codon:yes stop_codon:yes gene_type:complete